MDNAQKAIMIGVGLFITIIIISLVLLTTNIGSTFTKKSTTELGNTTEEMQNQLIKDYDNKMYSAPEVLNIINKYYNSNTISITGIGKVGYKYITIIAKYTNETSYVSNKSNFLDFNDSYYKKVPLSDFMDKNSSRYIAPGTKYNTYLIRNRVDGPVVGISIERSK